MYRHIHHHTSHMRYVYVICKVIIKYVEEIKYDDQCASFGAWMNEWMLRRSVEHGKFEQHYYYYSYILDNIYLFFSLYKHLLIPLLIFLLWLCCMFVPSFHSGAYTQIYWIQIRYERIPEMNIYDLRYRKQQSHHAIIIIIMIIIIWVSLAVKSQ